MQIGFELITQRVWSILPGASFSIGVLWNGTKIASTIGKDVYHHNVIILPRKILTASGRLNYSSQETAKYFEPVQASPCQLVQCPADPPTDLQVAITIPKASLVDTIYQTTYLSMWQRKENETKNTKTIIYFDPQSIQHVQKGQFQIDLSYLAHRGL